MMKTYARKMLRTARGAAGAVKAPLDVARGRIIQALPIAPDFKGAYASMDEALAKQPKRALVGYDHDEVAPVSFDRMCDVAVWDYPVIMWLERLMPNAKALIDAGGHMGTKYRAFSKLLDLENGPEWIVYDLPAIVRAGARQAEADGLKIGFQHDISQLPPAEILLASGLMQYYPGPMSKMVAELPTRPRHLILNKVAVREGATVVTMSKIGPSWVPYQIRNRAEFVADVEASGYRMLDQWDIPPLGHVIATHPELGRSQSLGFVFEAID